MQTRFPATYLLTNTGSFAAKQSSSLLTKYRSLAAKQSRALLNNYPLLVVFIGSLLLFTIIGLVAGISAIPPTPPPPAPPARRASPSSRSSRPCWFPPGSRRCRNTCVPWRGLHTLACGLYRSWFAWAALVDARAVRGKGAIALVGT